MLDRFLPRQIDNTYSGSKVALWIFGLVVLVKGMISVNSMLNGHYVASSADGIPLDTFTPACAQMVVSDFATWGLAMLMICLLCVLALVRYRAMVPLMFAVLLVENLARKLIAYLIPVEHVNAGAGFVNPALIALMVIGLVLSVWIPWSRRPA